MMTNLIKALVVCTVLQIGSCLGMMAYLAVHNNNMSREYSLLSERNSNAYTDASVLALYNRIETEMAYNRAQTTIEITKAIELANARNSMTQGSQK
jgi:hypothetical protein